MDSCNYDIKLDQHPPETTQQFRGSKNLTDKSNRHCSLFQQQNLPIRIRYKLSSLINERMNEKITANKTVKPIISFTVKNASSSFNIHKDQQDSKTAMISVKLIITLPTRPEQNGQQQPATCQLFVSSSIYSRTQAYHTKMLQLPPHSISHGAMCYNKHISLH